MPPLHRPLAGVAWSRDTAGAKGVGESAAIANAVVDALWHLGVRHIDIPITPPKVWKLLMEKGVAE